MSGTRIRLVERKALFVTRRHLLAAEVLYCEIELEGEEARRDGGASTTHRTRAAERRRVEYHLTYQWQRPDLFGSTPRTEEHTAEQLEEK